MKKINTLNKKVKKILKVFLISTKLYYIVKYFNRKKALILMYHNFCRDGEDSHMNLCISIKTFENHIKYLKKYYNIVPLSDLVNRLRRKEDFSPYSVAITFDDGYRNNFLLAYPVIKKYNIPVTIFLSSGYIDTRKLLWQNKLEFAIFEADKKEINISFDHQNYKYFIRNRNEKIETYNCIKEKLKALDNTLLESQLNDLFNQLEVEISYEEARNYQMLSLEDISLMDNHLITYGSHSNSHAILTKVKHNNYDSEIAGSKKLLQQKINREIEFFCYPNGNFNSDIIKFVKKHYKAGVTTKPGFVTIDTDPFELPRVGTKAKISDFIWALIRPT